SVLERSVGEWVGLLPAMNSTSKAGAVGFLRYAWGQLEVAATGGGAEAEYQRHVWDARRLGVPVMVGHHRVSFERIPPSPAAPNGQDLGAGPPGRGNVLWCYPPGRDRAELVRLLARTRPPTRTGPLGDHP